MKPHLQTFFFEDAFYQQRIAARLITWEPEKKLYRLSLYFQGKYICCENVSIAGVTLLPPPALLNVLLKLGNHSG